MGVHTTPLIRFAQHRRTTLADGSLNPQPTLGLRRRR